MQGPYQHDWHFLTAMRVVLRHSVCAPLQILDLPNTTVFAGARSPEKAEDLQRLSQQFEGRLFAVPLDLSDSNTVQVPCE